MITPEPTFISIGSNIEPEEHLLQAIPQLAQLGQFRRISNVYQNPAVGSIGQDDFLNAAALIDTFYSPMEIRSELRSIETRLGRVRTDDKFAPRTIDLDLEILGNQRIETGEFSLPDPDILLRPHLAIPLAELDPTFLHPITGETLEEIAQKLRAGAAMNLKEELSKTLANLVAGLIS